MSDCMQKTYQSPRLLREMRLKEIDGSLLNESDQIELHYERGCLLAELGRAAEANRVFQRILAWDPMHWGALTSLGDGFFSMHLRAEAREAYLEAVTRHPNNAKSHVNLAHLLRDCGEQTLARYHYETALRLAPDEAGAHEGMVHLLMDLGEKEAAHQHLKQAFQNRAVTHFSYHGTGKPIAILVFIAGDGGDLPFHKLLDFGVFMVTTLAVEFHDPSVPLPPHHLIFNAIGDADLSGTALTAAAKVLERITSPVINPPSSVLATGRSTNAERLAGVPGVVTPKIIRLSRETLSESDAPAILSNQGFDFPFLLRTPGFHTGRFFKYVERPDQMATALRELPGEDLAVIQFLNVRNADGKFRKYRVMMVNGKLYPLHAAVSRDWKVHYFSADMVDHPEHRAEDATFLQNMPQVIGEIGMKALEKICNLQGLDYAGIDFSLSATGELIVFEANATMTVLLPEQGEKWNYRRTPVHRILNAVQQMVVTRAKIES